MHRGSGHIKAPALRKRGLWRLNGTAHTKGAELGRGGCSPGLSAPQRMRGPGPKELPDVGPSGTPHECARSGADASIEQSGNERSRELSWNKKGAEGGHRSSLGKPAVWPVCR